MSKRTVVIEGETFRAGGGDWFEPVSEMTEVLVVDVYDGEVPDLGCLVDVGDEEDLWKGLKGGRAPR